MGRALETLSMSAASLRLQGTAIVGSDPRDDMQKGLPMLRPYRLWKILQNEIEADLWSVSIARAFPPEVRWHVEEIIFREIKSD